MTNIYKWATICPLIGGLTIAGKQVTGVDPVALFSYSPFRFNDANTKAYFPDVPFHTLDEIVDFDHKPYRNLDFVQALCPCAGLSMLSAGSEAHRDTVNYWMLESAKFVTGKLKPRVFWGENAPALYTNYGESVREELRLIGAENGYSFTVYATNTLLHGVPQNRKRTFYFFWRDETAPYLGYYKREHKSLVEYMKEIPSDIHGQSEKDFEMSKEILMNEPYVQFLNDKYQGEGIKQFRNHPIKGERQQLTMMQYLIESNQVAEARDWFEKQGREKNRAHADRIFNKVQDRQGFWDGSIPRFRPDAHFGTLINRTVHALHPTEDRSLTPRECMHLMALPHDFNLVSEELNHICQNVPVCTGADMTREVIAYLNGEREMSTSKFVMQSNHKERIDHRDSIFFE
jgi:site-specific DNA-cytosine methylase